jgi:NADP-dependent 3-hydroxy acid dehydrogenase YdfG
MNNLIVSGASRGIGRAIALHFAKEGWNVAFCSRNMKKLLALERELEGVNPKGRFLAYVCDVSNQKDLKDFASEAKKFLGDIDLLVNNAGIFLPGNVHELDDDSFDQLWRTNVTSAFTLTKEIVGDMKSKKKGHIFNMSSIAGFMNYPNGGAYNVTKHALTGYSKTIRDELKDFGIRVTTVYPGATLTDSWAEAGLPEERLMKASDIAQSIYDIYNLSDRTVVEDIVLRPQLGDI